MGNLMFCAVENFIYLFPEARIHVFYFLKPYKICGLFFMTKT